VPQAWYSQINTYLSGFVFTKSEEEANIYHIVLDDKLLILVSYVYDLILTGDENLIYSFKKYLVRDFEMKDMGLMHYFLEMEVWQGDGELFVSQGKYASEILQIFHMESYKPMEAPLGKN